MDSDVVQITLTFGAGALLVWKEMYRNAHVMRKISFTSSELTIFSSQGKKKRSPCFEVQENQNDEGKATSVLKIPSENFSHLEAN